MASKKKSRKTYPKLRLLVNLFSAVILILIGSFLIFRVSLDRVQTQSTFESSSSPSPTIFAKPAEIYIPKLARTLSISDGSYENNRWTISATGVSYLVTSAKLGEVGNVVVYGHNTKPILGGLPAVRAGDIVEIKGEDGKIYKYEIFEAKQIKPTQVEILNQTEDSRLTIYTCSGFLDTARFVVVGRLVS